MYMGFRAAYAATQIISCKRKALLFFHQDNAKWYYACFRTSQVRSKTNARRPLCQIYKSPNENIQSFKKEKEESPWTVEQMKAYIKLEWEIFCFQNYTNLSPQFPNQTVIFMPLSQLLWNSAHTSKLHRVNHCIIFIHI